MERKEELGEVDISRGESVEHELNRLIEKRHGQHTTEEGHRPSEELWKASVEGYNYERERQLRAAWCEYHQDQAARHRATLETLIARHKAAAARLQATDERKLT
jgi:hypothetical protein